MADRNFLKRIDEACNDALSEIEFFFPRRDSRHIRIDDIHTGWLGLNQGNHGDMVRLNVNVGIHSSRVQEILDYSPEKKSKKRKNTWNPVHSDTLGSIVPNNDEVDAIQFFVGLPVEQEAKRLALLVGEYAVPWMFKNASDHKLCHMVEAAYNEWPRKPETLASLYHLTNRTDEAFSLLEGVIEAERHNSEIGERVKSFYQKLRQYVMH